MADQATDPKAQERKSRPPGAGPRSYGSSSDDFGYGDDAGSFGYDEGFDGRKRYAQVAEKGRCRFCRDKVTRVDYKDVLTLEKLCSNQGRIFSRKRSGNCASHQRMVKKAIKQARVIGLMPFTV
jgi:small subunit ribosomal protein S18